MDHNIALQVHDLHFGYRPSEPILKKVSFSISNGSFIAIIGPNGAGKSTLLKLIAGLLKPSQGSIKTSSQTIAYVPQSLSVDRKFPITVFEVILGGRVGKLSWRGFSSLDYKKAEEALHNVGLEEVQHAPFGELSTGQAQRILIARALAQEASLLLLDEPTSCIDPEAEKSILEIVHSLQGKKTILMVTHDVQSILSHVQAVLCIHGEALMMKPEEVCDHFIVGLYHTPFSTHGAV